MNDTYRPRLTFGAAVVAVALVGLVIAFELRLLLHPDRTVADSLEYAFVQAGLWTAAFSVVSAVTTSRRERGPERLAYRSAIRSGSLPTDQDELDWPVLLAERLHGLRAAATVMRILGVLCLLGAALLLIRLHRMDPLVLLVTVGGGVTAVALIEVSVYVIRRRISMLQRQLES